MRASRSRPPPPGALRLSRATPNPSSDGWNVAFTLATHQPARIEVLDVSGRNVMTRDLTGLGPGEHRVRLTTRAGIPSGVYLIRLRQGARAITTKAVAAR